MIYRLAVRVAAVVMFAIVAAGAVTPPAVALDPDDLAAVRGGEFVCSAPQHDVAGVDCNECTSDGNGGSVWCDSTEIDMMHFYVAGPPPAYVFDYPEVDCGGTATYFTSTNCTGMPPWVTTECGRTFTDNAFVRIDYGINCP